MPDELTEEQLQEIGARGAREAIEAAKTSAARDAYGDSSAAGGALGSQARPSQTTGPEAAWGRVLDRLKRGDGGQDGQFKRDFNEGIGTRIREAANAAVNDPSYRSFSKPGTSEDRKLRDERRRQRGGSL